MSLNSILNIATSGLYASQSGIKTVSQNIANVNTEGYVRVEQQQSAVNLNGSLGGVTTSVVRRAANNFFQSASINANTSASESSVIAEFLDQVQMVFGDPTAEGSLFSRIDSALSSFETAVLNPGSTSVRRDILSQMNSVLSQLESTSNQISQVRNNVDSEISNSINEVNSILENIAKVNMDVMRGNIAGDANGALQQQDELINQLSQYIDIRVDRNSAGVANIYTSDGTFLAGYNSSKLSYTPSDAGQSTFNSINISFAGDETLRSADRSIQGGKLRGLLDLRNNDIAEVSDNIGEFAGKLADAINAVHNTNAALPAISSAVGTDTGLLASDALNFTGRTTIGVVASDGTLQSKIDIDFSAGTISVNGGAATAFTGTIGGFTSALNTALGGLGTASFANGKLSLNSNNANNGFIFDEPTSGGSMRGEKAFAHFFGLNNLIQSTQPTSYATGLSGTDTHGFAGGSSFTMRLTNASGQVVADREIPLAAGGTMNDILTSLNDPVNGYGLYGSFSLDTTGQMKWTANANAQDYNMTMKEDVGPRGDTQISFGQLTGLNQDKRAARAGTLSIDKSIMADPKKLALALPDLSSVSIGAVAVGIGDSKGAQALFNVSNDTFNFNSSLGLAGRNMTLSEYASTLAGDLATRASTAESNRDSAEALKTEATNRRSNLEGVNLDEELIKLTSFQQSYSAAARLIKAADEMYETLLSAL